MLHRWRVERWQDNDLPAKPVQLSTHGCSPSHAPTASTASPVRSTGAVAASLTCTRNWVDLAGEEFMANITQGVFQDFPIWQNKVYRANPVLCEGDEFLSMFRKWVRQFYTDPA